MAGQLLLHCAICVVACSLLVTVWWHVFGLIETGRLRTLAATERDITNLARVSEEHAERTFSSLDQTLRLVQFEYASRGRQLSLGVLQAAGQIDGRVLLQVATTNAQGQLVQSTQPFAGPIDLSDREHFRVHAAGHGDSLFISHPMLGRVSGKLSIQVSRPLFDKTGAFAGIVVASLDPAYFTRFYGELQLGGRGVATLFGTDGIVRARRVGTEDQYVGDLSASPVFARLAKRQQFGTYTSPGLIDGVERMLHFRKLQSYPMLVAIGADPRDALRNHAQAASNLLNQAALASLFLVAVAASLSWYVVLRRRHTGDQARALALLQELTSRVPGAVYQLWVQADGKARFQFASSGFRETFGLGSASQPTDTVAEVLARVHPDDLAQRTASFALASRNVGPWDCEYRIQHPAGDLRWVLEQAAPQLLDDGSTMWYGYVSDVTDRKQADEQVRIAATAFESHEGMFITDNNANILRVNQAFTRITGYSAEEAVGQTPRLLHSGRQGADFYGSMRKAIADQGCWQGEVWNRRKDGEVFPEWLTISAVRDETGSVTHYVSTFADISSRKVAENQIRNLAFFDPLTGLPNRRLFLDRLQAALSNKGAAPSKCALFFIDLDAFKILNDTQGHSQGDVMLRQVAERLNFCVRNDDTVARLGSDEFVVMLQNLPTEAGAAEAEVKRVGEQILATLRQPYQLIQFTHHSSAGIGVTLFQPGDLLVVEDLLKRADLALHKAKSAGGDTLRFFDPEMQASMLARARLEADMRQGLLEQQFLLYYQPQVNQYGDLTGVEALVRWKHPVRGMVSPAEFIPLAEETRLVLPLGHWVLEAACQQLKQWSAQPYSADLTISVNVSALQFLGEQFVPDVLATLQRTGAPARRLKIELTESLLVNDVGGIIAKMHELKAHGVGFSLDDFGTGYSSLSYLKRLPLDQLKIDQSFLQEALTNSKDAAIVQATITLGNSLGMTVIAEGVETETQRLFLQARGCNHFQGYLFGRPGTIESLQSFFTATNPA
ncbi:MAG: EAL domain-containing protein [Pseudomonadota bacterium]